MLRIRLQRLGRRNCPHYRFVVTDARNKRDGKCLEKLGQYQPAEKDVKKVTLNLERYRHWVKLGAQPSEAVASILKGCRLKPGADAAVASPDAAVVAPTPAAAPAP